MTFKICIAILALYKSSLLKLLILSVAAPVIFSNKKDIYKNRYLQNRYESLSTALVHFGLHYLSLPYVCVANKLGS